MYRVVVPIFAIVFIVGSNAVSNQLKCSKAGMIKLDKNTREMFMFGAPVRQYPTSSAKVQEFCSVNKAHETYLAEYGKQCLDNLSKQVINLLSYSVTATNKKFCGGRRKTAFMKWAACGNAAKPETIKCWHEINRNLPAIIKVPNKLKIPMICCTYFKWKDCNLEAYRKMGPRTCPESSVSGFEAIIDAYAIDVLRLLCGDYTEDSDKCGPVMRKIQLDPGQPQYVSPLLPFIDILRSIE